MNAWLLKITRICLAFVNKNNHLTDVMGIFKRAGTNPAIPEKCTANLYSVRFEQNLNGKCNGSLSRTAVQYSIAWQSSNGFSIELMIIFN